jgi:hypothetical protein
MTDDRNGLAEDFLREAVVRSRERQAALTALRRTSAPGAGTCGLGERAAVVLDLSDHGRDLFARLFRDDLPEPGLKRIHSAMAGWIERQDALDRKRNHFLKEFRVRHGFDRSLYPLELLAEFEAGLARINAQEDSSRRVAAERLIALAP